MRQSLSHLSDEERRDIEDCYDDGPEDREELPSGICDDCGDACTASRQDVGVDGRAVWEYLSCCGVAVVEGGTKVVRNSVHVCRRDHKDGRIVKGQAYSVRVTHHWREDGPGWYTQKKALLATQ